MTQEEKYRKALLEARAVLEPCLKYSNGKVREALDSIDKELKSFESDDERILRVISEAVITFFSDYANDFEDEDRDAALAWLEKQKEQDWNKKPCLTCQEYKNGHKQGYTEGCTAGYNKAMKEVEQKEQKPEWSEEDEEMLDSIIRVVCGVGIQPNGLREKQVSFLKSLRPQYHGDVTMTEAYKMGLEAGKASSWKPSEEQMEALHTAMYLEEMQFYGGLKDKLRDLYVQLKKL